MINANLGSKPTQARVGRANQRYNPKTGARMIAGCICLNKDKDKVIMISSSKHPNKWVLPKGGIELDEGDDFIVSAVRETWEEAGCEGKISCKLPVVLDARGNGAPVLPQGKDFEPSNVIPKSEFHLYEMVVTDLSPKWPESDSRQRRWCTYSEAKHELLKSNRIELIQALESSSMKKDVEGIKGVDEY